MRVLLSNDDGVYAPGIIILHKALAEIADVIVVAPDMDRSAASKSLTIDKPIRPRTLENNFVSINGTPTDCVHYALTAYMEEPPDMVVAGINSDSNLGDNVMYSGTVAAATEGRFLGFPSLATSLVPCNGWPAGKHYADAAKVVKNIIQYLLVEPLPSDTILNINIPDLPFEQLKGLKVTRLGQRHRSQPMVRAEDPRGQTVYWVGPSIGTEQDTGPDTDFYAVNNGYVSITPLEIDLTRYSMFDKLTVWANKFKL